MPDVLAGFRVGWVGVSVDQECRGWMCFEEVVYEGNDGNDCRGWCKKA